MKFAYRTSRKEQIKLPKGFTKLLLHSCCAPCAGEMMEAMVESGLDITVFFYNPNIHPKKEYVIRKKENIRYCKKLNIPFIDGDYDTANWFKKAKGLEWEPERGKRCGICFEMRFDKTAAFAYENKFSLISSSLGISRWKNMDQINENGKKAAARYPGITYWTYNWRKKGGSARMYEIAKREQFYQQQYCGCIYSLRDTNTHREKDGRQKIQVGETWYQEKLADARLTDGV